MTRQVKGQRDALIAANAETERRRRLFDSVLSGVTAGVIGLDDAGRIEMMNAAAAALVDLDPEAAAGRPLVEAVPEFAALLDRLEARKTGVAQTEVRLRRKGRERDLLARVATRSADDDHLEGYVVTFDDVTDLVVAQRMAAWGDVARRIAHEVKNPLTPIQLSAERLRRKFGPMVGEDRATLEQYADVIVRQTSDLRRIVDEFSKFARMPAPERRPARRRQARHRRGGPAGVGAARHPLPARAAGRGGAGASRRNDDQPGGHQPPEERRRGDRRAAHEGARLRARRDPRGARRRARAAGHRHRRTTAPGCPTSRRGCSSPT